jgi:serine/threonine protein kinase
MASLAGRSIGPCEILGPIGAGSMGEVHKARDTRRNRIVAINLLNDAAHIPGGGNRLLREAQAASALNHPNIVIVHDVVSQDGCDVIVMEFIEGSTLVDQIGRKGMPLRDALQHLAQIASALAAALADGMVHLEFAISAASELGIDQTSADAGLPAVSGDHVGRVRHRDY